MKTQVGIIGAGPAGLLLGRILQAHGIDAVVVERRSRDYVLKRIRAGVLEQGTVDTLRKYGVAERLDREGLPHADMKLFWKGERHSIPMTGEGGRRMTTYGQNKIVEDLVLRREADGLPLIFDAEVKAIENVTDRPVIHYDHNGEAQTLECDFVAGCDGFWGVSRKHMPDADAHSFEKVFPFSWFGLLAEAKTSTETRGFCHSERGLAVSSSRGPDVSRLYLQVPPDFDMASMSDDQIWDELSLRLANQYGKTLNRGPIIDKAVVRLRGFICEKMVHGRLALAGDACHTVPPSGAKGLNLAVGDVRLLSEAIVSLLQENDDSKLARYPDLALQRIWPTVHWSCTMSDVFHIFPGQTAFDTRRQYEVLNFWAYDETGQRVFRENMLGRPLPQY
ncbi:4-hydroxybenzoate 3-monooxygenase [Pararhodobacter aggregans]|uniref:4-hydroxybenzoate 3-monooxygenase n=1 Tax=Pararhodobacter aggregans TaxID=404875 RepID=A0A2T7UST8_9RHOB|nr:4-hydroxybenzoate 3-monooxygenase [Pararhodobacter aggregans]PTX03517.1 p-hydroxybenzoate 3-monooxygenase [Pararhodobacter aggregans]PVE47803.1 4-hydroxybenzoate 3-monooxygenase [Pararhodobacter aggregans]